MVTENFSTIFLILHILFILSDQVRSDIIVHQ
jgi:hypothetical protein